MQVIEAVKAETVKFEQTMQELNQKLDKQKLMLQNHYRLIDERLRQTTEQKTSLWKKLFCFT